jgi:hypothetical protein
MTFFNQKNMPRILTATELVGIFALVAIIAGLLVRSVYATGYAAPVFSASTMSASEARNGTITVSLSPTTTDALVGHNLFSLDVDATSTLVGAQAEIGFNPSIVKVLSMDAGTLIRGNNQKDTAGGYFADSLIDNSAGTTRVVASSLYPAAAGVGPGQILRFEIRCKGAGSTAITVSGLVLSGENGAKFASQGQGGTIVCNAAAVPSSTWWSMVLATLTLGVLIMWRIRRRVVYRLN